MIRSYALTDIGQKRQLNQDYIYRSETPVGNLPNVFIVADGMGDTMRGTMPPDLRWRPWWRRSVLLLRKMPLRS